MLRSLVTAALRHRVVVVVAAAVFLVFGIWLARHTPLDVFPEFAPPLVEVQVEVPGMSSEAVENLVTLPLENAVNGIPQMTTLRSKSVQGLSSVQMLFERGTDLYHARQMVTERVAVLVPQLPQQARTPQLMPPLSSTSRVLKIGLTAKRSDELAPGEPQLTQTDVSVLMKWTIGPRLLAVPGVANVSTYGLHDRQYQVLVDPNNLRDHGVTLEQVKQAARQGAAYGSAGFHDTPNQRLALQYSTRIHDPADLGQTVVAFRNGQPVLLSQVATLTAGNPPHIGEGVINNEPGLLVVVEKYPWANTLQVTYDVEAVVESMKGSLPGVGITTTIFRPATFIEQALGNLRHALLLGCGLVVLILITFLFEWRTALISLLAFLPLVLTAWVLMRVSLTMRDPIVLGILSAEAVLAVAILVAFFFEWRTAIISLAAIPLSLISSVVVLHLMGGTVNTMILAGLAIAVGEVVDDAIIDVENIVRRLRLNSAAGNPQSAFRVVLDASLEVRSAVVYASFIVALVCLPIFFMSGVGGAFFRPLATAYILSVMASLVVALIVTPALALMLLPGRRLQHRDPPVVRGIRWVYRHILLPPFLAVPVFTWLVLLLLLGGAGYGYLQLKKEYLPRFQEKDFLMHWIAKPGTSIDFMRRDIQTISREMLAETPVTQFGAHIARAEIGEEVVGPNFAELWISLGDYEGDYATARRQIEDVMARHAGFEHDLLTYLQERIKEVLSGTGAAVVVRVYGPDLAMLRSKAQQVRQAIEGSGEVERVPGVVDLRVEPQVLVPQLELVVNPSRAAAHGLTPRGILDAVSTLVNGARVGEVHEGQRIYDVVVWSAPEVRYSWMDLRRLPLDLPTGQGTVPLEAVADLRLINAPNTIRHDMASRCIDVTCNVSGSDLGSVAQEIEQRVRPLQEQGYRIELLGEYQARTENLRQMYGAILISLVGIALLLYIDFRSFRLTVLVLLTLPFALVGGVAAAYLTGGVLSLGSLVGFITVLGIAARNGIMLVSHYRHLQAVEGVPFGRELILRGAEERVSPILMTALAAGLGLLPLALGGNKPGYEVEFPMAVVILGGLITSTLLNLLVLPVLYQGLGHKAVVFEQEA
jgi:Cu/Ag efflux pump CusA